MKKYILVSLLYSLTNCYATDDLKDFKGRYFVVLNIASEMLRLYERICEDTCINKMILESEVVVGEDKNLKPGSTGKGRSILGSYRLTGWRKFYEDSEKHYPAWFDESYPPVPQALVHQPLLWFSDKYMPVNSEGKITGKMRGAFGWYTAFLEPNAMGQWIHGTIGWGEDKEFYIVNTKTLLPNIAFDPRSSGCIRNNNEAIAFLRDILEIGTPIIKIYAKERVFDPTSPMYKNKKAEWKYVLTKDKGIRAERDYILKYLNVSSEDLDMYWKLKRSFSSLLLASTYPLNHVIEVGTYTYDTHPDAVDFIPGEKISRYGRKYNHNGNIYGIKSTDVSGFFFVDTGLLYNYKHPTKVLLVSGYLDEVTPPWMIKN